MNIMTSKGLLKRSLVVSTLLVPTMTMQAEELDSLRQGASLEQVTITATKRIALKRELPLSVSLLDKSLLEQTQFQGIRDINASIPNVYIPDFGSSRSTPIFIRGIGSRRVNMIGFYSDGVPLLDGESIDADYSDIRAIEVLRGPQGTLYGRGAMGGIINLTTYKPLEVQMTNVNLQAGNYGLMGLNAQSYQAVSDRVGLSAAIGYLHRGGYYTNKYNGRRVDPSNNYSAKFGIQYKYEGWNTNFFAQYQRRAQGAYPYALVGSDGSLSDVNYDGEGAYTRNLITLGLSLQKVWSNGLTLKSGTSYQHMTDELLMDQDFLPMDAITAEMATRRNSVTEELSLSQKIGRYSWITGVYAFHTLADRGVDNRIKMLPRMNQLVRYDYHEPNSALALYHQSSYQITDRLTAELGLRYEWEWSKQTLDSRITNYLIAGSRLVERQYPFSKTFQQFTPKFSLVYRLGTEHRVYASVQRGFQSGGFNLQFDDPKEQSYDPEYSWNYELGAHIYGLDGRLQLDGAVFYIDWEQQQVAQVLQNQLGSKITNAGHSKSLGAEFSLTYRPVDALNLALSYGYTKATFEKYEEYNASSRGNVSRDGNYIPQVPRQTISAGADYSIKTGLKSVEAIKLGVQYRGLGDLYWDTANAQKQAFYSLVDAQLSFNSKHYSLELWGRNLANTEYRSFQFNNQGRNFAQLGIPRHFGATLRIKL